MALKDVIHAVTLKQSVVLRRAGETVEDEMKDDDRSEAFAGPAEATQQVNKITWALAGWAFRRSRPLIPTDRDHLFRSIATSAARVLTAPLDDGGDVSLLWVGQARREAVPVVNRRDPRATRSALTADAAARAGGPC